MMKQRELSQIPFSGDKKQTFFFGCLLHFYLFSIVLVADANFSSRCILSRVL